MVSFFCAKWPALCTVDQTCVWKLSMVEPVQSRRRSYNLSGGVVSFGDCGFSTARYFTFPHIITNSLTWEKVRDELAEGRPTCFTDKCYHAWWVDSADDAAALLSVMQKLTVPVGFDTETTHWSPKLSLPGITGKKKSIKGLSPSHPNWKPKLTTMQFSWGLASYVVAGHLWWVFADWLRDTAILDGANIGYEFATLAAAGVKAIRFHRDVLSMHSVYNELSHAKAPGLKPAGKLFVGIDTIDFSSVVPKGKDFAYALEHNFEAAVEYAAQDAWLTTILADVLENKLRSMPTSPTSTAWDIYRRWNIGFQTECIRMEQAGFPIKTDVLQAQYADVEEKAKAELVNAQALLGRTVNLNSAAQLRPIYYEARKNPVTLTTDSHYCLLCKKPITKSTGNTCPIHGKGALVNNPAVSKPMLQTWAKGGDQLAKAIIKYRELRKIQATWLDGFWKYAGGIGWGHPSINSTGTVSGRLAAGIWITAPSSIRKALGFPEDSDQCLIGADEGQLELRVLAHVTGDDVICSAFNKELDLHSYSAALIRVFSQQGVEATQNEAVVMDVYHDIHEAHSKADRIANGSGEVMTAEDTAAVEERRQTKRVNFGLIYGMGEAKLAADAGKTQAWAKELMTVIWSIYAGARAYYDAQLELIKEQGYLQTINGRWQRLPHLRSEDAGEREYGRRLSMNKPCQCGAADIIAAAMIQVGIDLEAGGAFGTEGRMAYGTWVAGKYQLEAEHIPWDLDDLPPKLVENLGLLGKLGFVLILQCHDELILRGPKAHAKEAAARLKTIMENPLGSVVKLRVPLAVGAGHGQTWADLK